MLSYLLSLFPLMTRFYGLDPEYQLRMPARRWLFYSKALAPLMALERTWDLMIEHPSDPRRIMRSLRRLAEPYTSVEPRKRGAGRPTVSASDEPILQQIVPFMAHPQLRQFITIRKKPKPEGGSGD